MQGYCDVYKWTILKRTSPGVKCLHPTSSRREMCTSSVSNVIYHTFSHGAAFYTLNGNNVNVMLECLLKYSHKELQFDTNYKQFRRLTPKSPHSEGKFWTEIFRQVKLRNLSYTFIASRQCKDNEMRISSYFCNKVKPVERGQPRVHTKTDCLKQMTP